MSFQKKEKTNIKLWSLDENPEENTSNEEIKAKLTSFIKKCHQLLYSKSSIVGVKAQNDIMKILSVKILGEWNNLEKSMKGENFQNDWKKFSKKLISNYKNIFYEQDKFFNCKDDNTLCKIIQETKNFDCNEDMKDSFATSYGDIYEYFMSSYGKKSSSGSKELGQFFTPRKLIHLIFHGLNLSQFIQDKDNFSIYDPCMGTGGFLTRLYKLGNIKPENIYGCETEIDTIKFGVLSVYLTTGIISEGIKKCNSLSENPFISNKKFSGIVTNPPFGTSMDYKDLKKKYKETFEDSPVSFEEVYPIKTNNGACLFIQHCVYMLEENGFCAIVLPDGELFEGNSNWSKKFRQWLSEQVNIRTILKVPSGTFEHAGVKTNVVIFTKDGPTQNINFIETTKECDEVKDMFSISVEELKITGYSLDIGEYLVEETDNYDVPMVALGEVINLTAGYAFDVKKFNFENNGVPIIKVKNMLEKTNKIEFNENKQPYIIKNNSYDKYIIKKGDILFSIGGSMKVGIYEFDNYSYLNQHICKIDSFDERVIKEYIKLYLIYKIIPQFSSSCQTSSIPFITLKTIKEKIKIPLPSLEIQQQIVDELSQIESSIETIELRISQMKFEKDQYKKYGRKAEIRELLKDSEEKMLGEVCELKEKGNTNSKSITNTGEYPFYSASVKNPAGTHNSYCFDGNEYILFIKSGGNGKNPISYSHGIGKVYYVTGKTSGNSEVVKISVQGNLSLKYICKYLKSKQLTIQKFAKYSANGNLGHINMDKFKKLKIPLPSQEIQEQCIALFEEKEKFIQSIDDKINSEKEYITHLKNLAKDVISSYC